MERVDAGLDPRVDWRPPTADELSMLVDEAPPGVNPLRTNLLAIPAWLRTAWWDHVDQTGYERFASDVLEFLRFKDLPLPALCEIEVAVSRPDQTRTRLHEATKAAPLVVDNTVATPLLQKPLEFGALASMYSLTKSVSGHSDVLGGAVVTRDQELARALRDWRTAGGGIPGPFESWLVLRGMRTLPWRMRAHSENAMKVADFLSEKLGV